MRKSVLTMLGLLVVVSLVLAACGTPEVVEKPVEVTRVVVETQIVQGASVEVTKIVKEEVTKEVVKEVVVTATPVPAEKAPDVLGLPRNEMFIADILTGHLGTPSNFNEWVGWKSRDRGMQNLANEPLWSVDFATGNIIPGLAAGDPVYNDDFTEVTIPLRQGVAWDDGVAILIGRRGLYHRDADEVP